MNIFAKICYFTVFVDVAFAICARFVDHDYGQTSYWMAWGIINYLVGGYWERRGPFTNPPTTTSRPLAPQQQEK